MKPITLSEIVEGYIKEHNLPFYLEDNFAGENLMSIRKLPKGLANSVGFVSGNRLMVCIYNTHPHTDTVPSEWVNPFSKTFFEELDARLHLHINNSK